MFLSFTRWLSQAKSQNRKPIRQTATVRERFIPQLEQLETRLAPANFTVTNLSDSGVSGDGSLRGEIAAAQTAGSGNIVNFKPGLSGTISLTKGNLSLTTGITIDGTGASITINGSALTGIALGGVFYVNTTVAVALDSLTIRSGKASGGGGGIYNSGGGNLTLTNDTLSGNSANYGGGIYNTHGNLTLTNDTLSGNSAGNSGGGIYNSYGNLTLTNDTLSGNWAVNAGGISNYFGNLTLTNDTLGGNSANNFGGGIYNQSGATATVYDTIIAGNTASAGPDFNGTVTTDNGYNLIGNTSSSTGFTGTGDILNPTYFGLGALQNNGGPTQTIALLPGSPAIGTGPTNGNLFTDQRGFPRPANPNHIDIGAYENQSQLFTLTPPGTQTTTALTPTSFALGSFTYSGGAGNLWTTTVNWGDGSAQTSFLTLSQGTLPNQTHTYTTIGSYTVTISVQDLDGNFGQTTATVIVGGPIVVNTTADTDAKNSAVSPLDSSGNVSLRSAIEYANANSFAGSITFLPGLSGTISLLNTKGNLQITDTSNLTIDGSGATITVSGKNLTGISSGGVFFLNTTATDAINFLSISGGKAVRGGGVLDSLGNLSLANDTITGNSASYAGGGIYFQNAANTLTLTNDTVSHNTAPSGAGIFIQSGTASLTGVTLNNNVAGGAGGAINISQGNLTLTNDTLANNAAASGGGIYSNTASVNLANDTIAFNTSTGFGGGGIQTGGGSLTLYDTIVAANNYSDIYITFSTTYHDNGGNFTDGDPELGALQNNGGPTQTLAPLPGSPVLAAGITTGAPAFDQRGLPRTVNGKIDSGAFENQSQLFAVTAPPSYQTGQTGTGSAIQLGSFTYSGSAGNNWTVTVNWGDGTQTVFNTNHQGSLGTQGHVYAAVGRYTVLVGVSDANNNSGQATAAVVVGGTIVVNTLADTDAYHSNTSPLDTNGNISLRSALDFVNANDVAATIDFLSSLSGTIGLTLGNLQITDYSNLTIDGSGAKITVDGSALSGISQGGVFSINNSASDTIQSLTITGGQTNSGGGIYVYEAYPLTLIDDVITGNSAAAGGGGIDLAGSYGNLQITNSTIASNQAGTAGGGVNFATTYYSTLTITNSTIASNQTGTTGGGVNFSSAYYDFLTITNSTIASNQAGIAGGGVNASLGTSGSLQVVNSTIASNTAGTQGGGVNASVSSSNGSLQFANSTIAYNAAATGGGVSVSGGTTVYDTILADNTATTAGPDFSGTVTTDNGYNLVGNTGGSSGFSTSNHDILSPGNVYLGALQNNGGPTQTIALLPGSPALGKGNPSGAPSTDQRGFSRNLSNPIDIGAFENQSQLFALTNPANATTNAGQSTAFNLGSFTYSGNAGNVFKVDVNWGDNSNDTIFTVTNQGTLGTQNHTFLTAGSYNLVITITDANGNFAPSTSPLATVTVNPHITLSPTNLPVDTAGNLYSQAFSAAGGVAGSYSFSTTGNTDGLTFAGSTLTGTPTVAGTFSFTVTATDSGSNTGSQSYVLTVLAGTAQDLIISSGNGQNGTAGTALPNPLIVQLTDQYGNPIAGATVNWAVVSGGGSFAGSGSTTSVTNSAGLASVAATLGATPASNSYSATVGALTPVTFIESASAPSVATSITVTAGSPQSAAVNSSFVTNLSATVTDQFGNPVSGVTVVFAAPSSGPSGTFAGSPSSAAVSEITNMSGVATAPTFTANIFAGTYIVTASTSGVTSPAKFTLSNLSSLGTSANAIYVHNVYALLLNRLPDSGARGWVALLNQATPPATVVQDIERTTEYLNDVVKGLYLHYLQRPADTNGLNSWTNLLTGGGTIEQVIDGLVASPEYFALHGSNNLQFVKALYNDILGRPGSSSEWQAWVNALNSGTTRGQVATDFLTSTEYQIDLVDSYYLEYLRRPADTVGQDAWVQALAAGVSDQAVLAGIFGSAEGYGRWS